MLALRVFPQTTKPVFRPYSAKGLIILKYLQFPAMQQQQYLHALNPFATAYGAIWFVHISASTHSPLHSTVLDAGSILGLPASLCSRHASVTNQYGKG